MAFISLAPPEKWHDLTPVDLTPDMSRRYSSRVNKKRTNAGFVGYFPQPTEKTDILYTADGIPHRVNLGTDFRELTGESFTHAVVAVDEKTHFFGMYVDPKKPTQEPQQRSPLKDLHFELDYIDDCLPTSLGGDPDGLDRMIIPFLSLKRPNSKCHVYTALTVESNVPTQLSATSILRLKGYCSSVKFGRKLCNIPQSNDKHSTHSISLFESIILR